VSRQKEHVIENFHNSSIFELNENHAFVSTLPCFQPSHSPAGAGAFFKKTN
jgi:hypothetical protein